MDRGKKNGLLKKKKKYLPSSWFLEKRKEKKKFGSSRINPFYAFFLFENPITMVPHAPMLR